MLIKSLTATSILLVLIATAPAPANADSFRCAKGIVSVGDSMEEVRPKCGQPDNAEFTQVPTNSPQPSIVQVMRWTYDGGPNTFVYYLDFVGDQVNYITSGDYGTKKK